MSNSQDFVFGKKLSFYYYMLIGKNYEAKLLLTPIIVSNISCTGDHHRRHSLQVKYHYYTMCTLQDMDINQELNQNVTDKGNTIRHVHIRGHDIKIYMTDDIYDLPVMSITSDR